MVPLSTHVLIRVLGGMDFWTQSKGYLISEQIAGDALRRSTPGILRCLVSQHYLKKQMVCLIPVPVTMQTTRLQGRHNRTLSALVKTE